MRAGMLAVAMLTAGLAPGALAQQTLDETRSPPQQRAAQQTQTPQTTIGAQMRSYAATLQVIEGQLRQAIQTAASSPAQQTQQGAVSQPQADLLQAIRSAWQGMQTVPPVLFNTDAYKQAERRMEKDVAEAQTTWETDRNQTVASADDAVKALEGLRQQVVQMASQPGAEAPARSIWTGGWGAR